ncbi:6-phosphogluconolactonase [Nocardioides sp. GXQ0305]|uniref:6-phosphogluconolactonase n=1 Tax=Nocardioides sp. GXQ0305 TaxID=3423912 RepID=UPI003D7E7973
MSTTRIEVFDDADALSRAVAGELLARLEAAQAGGGSPQVALTGGSIAERIHAALGEAGPRSEVDWGRVVVWWGDERFVAPDSAERNALDARRSFLDRVGVPDAHVHEVAATDTTATVGDAAAAYAEAIREHGSGAFEVVMLGIGPDGHCASLFPGHPALDVADAITVAVRESPKPPPERVSLTFEALNRSRAVWFVASGEEKAEAVARALADDGDLHETPARGVTGLPDVDGSPTEVVWFLDRPAASRL